jgi:hypothetical protein
MLTLLPEAAFRNGFYPNFRGLLFLGAGLSFLLFLLFFVLFVLFFIWRRAKHFGHRGHYGPMGFLQRFSTSELEEELARRKSASSLENEVAELKRQLADLQKEKSE